MDLAPADDQPAEAVVLETDFVEYAVIRIGGRGMPGRYDHGQ